MFPSTHFPVPCYMLRLVRHLLIRHPQKRWLAYLVCIDDAHDLLWKYHFNKLMEAETFLESIISGSLLGIVFFTVRWWDPETFAAMHPVGKAARISWPYVEDKSYLWTWLSVVPLVAYTLWQLLYFLTVNVLRRQRLLRDPKVMTSYRELSKKAQKANNVWWRLSGLLGDRNRPMMYILLQATFTVATLALTVPIFLSYRLHVIFQILKVSATIWNGRSFLLEVMPRQLVEKEKKKFEMKPIPAQPGQSEAEALTNGDHSNNTSVEESISPNGDHISGEENNS